MRGKVVVVTGAFGALGSATARAAMAAGAQVALLDRAPTPPAEIGQLSADAFVRGGVDLTDAVAADRVMGEIHQHAGGLDALINIAGGFRWQKIADGDSASWDAMFALNLETALNASRAALAYLRRSKAGRIVNIGALAALEAGTGMGPYAASKAAVHKLTESLAAELKEEGITVNAVLPSTLDTPVNRREMRDSDPSKWVSVQSLAGIILFLASDEARDITGALIPVAGRV
jgi:NAD(P)-dependent dehydrogenase (short-subunit alcohol dehydrogenase family)